MSRDQTAPRAPDEVTLNRLAQTFYEASGISLIRMTDKPLVVKGLRAVFDRLALELSPDDPPDDPPWSSGATAPGNYEATTGDQPTPRAPEPGRCSCGNRFDGDNLCMPSACQWEGLSPEPTALQHHSHGTKLITEATTHSHDGLPTHHHKGPGYASQLSDPPQDWLREQISEAIARSEGLGLTRAQHPVAWAQVDHVTAAVMDVLRGDGTVQP